MTDAEIDVAGKLSALEFVLEVMLANEMAALSAEQADDFKTQMLAKEGYIRRGPISVDELRAISDATSRHLSNFLDKVEERAAEIRNA